MVCMVFQLRDPWPYIRRRWNKALLIILYLACEGVLNKAEAMCDRMKLSTNGGP